MLMTKNHMRINRQVMTQPSTLMACELKALPMANVAEQSAVFGNTKENHVIAKGSRWFRIHGQCAPTETKKNHNAKLEVVSM